MKNGLSENIYHLYSENIFITNKVVTVVSRVSYCLIFSVLYTKGIRNNTKIEMNNRSNSGINKAMNKLMYTK